MIDSAPAGGRVNGETPQTAGPTASSAAEVGEMVLARVGAELQGASRCALLDYPHYDNVGDNAIWLGERICLRRLRIDVRYTCDMYSYSPARLPEGPLLMQGGGNLGDHYPIHQHFRERVLADFPARKVLQLPQSIAFSGQGTEGVEALERARRAFRTHPDLTLLLRDEASLQFARRQLDVRAELCPDAAFLLGELRRPLTAEVPVLWLARRDRAESLWAQPQSIDGEVAVDDWRFDQPPQLHRVSKVVTRLAQRWSPWLNALLGISEMTFDRVARQRLDRGLRMLARGEVVITDHLHGHILCSLMQIPHVVLDSRMGKVGECFRQLTQHWSGAVFADSPVHALELARELAERARSAASRRQQATGWAGCAG